jgi:ABC-type transport system, involved in lipoprotein release, permease component
MLSVLAVTMLWGVGTGVLNTGEELVDRTGRDLWVSGGPIALSPETVGGFQNPLTDAHATADTIEQREAIAAAVPLGFNAVYVSPNETGFETTFSVGVGEVGPSLEVTEGPGFSGGDTHRTGGSYDGPLNHEVVIGPTVADRYNLSPGDSLHLGGTIRNARANEFEIVGISPTFADLTGTETVTLYLSDAQTLTGNALADQASLISVGLAEGADPTTVKQSIETMYPELDVRTNRQQITQVIERQAVIISGGTSLSLLALVAGVGFSLGLVVSIVYQQRTELAAFRATGGSVGSLVLIALTQTATIGVVGGGLGLFATVPVASGLEQLTTVITGFDGLVRVSRTGYLLAAGLVGVFVFLGTIAAVWRVVRVDVTTNLQDGN